VKLGRVRWRMGIMIPLLRTNTPEHVWGVRVKLAHKPPGANGLDVVATWLHGGDEVLCGRRPAPLQGPRPASL